MELARHPQDPTRNLIGILFVMSLHALVVYALVSGFTRKGLEVIKKPIDVTIIQDISVPPPPPPPQRRMPEAPKSNTPPPAQTPYVPQPELPAEPRDGPVIPPSPEPPPAPYEIQPPAPPTHVEDTPPAPPATVRRNLVPIESFKPVYPRPAILARVEKGRVLARVNIDEKGHVTDVFIVSADPPRHFDNAVREALMKWRFRAEGEKYVGEIEVVFTLKD